MKNRNNNPPAVLSGIMDATSRTSTRIDKNIIDTQAK
jgi:hypothetical protein